LINIGGYLMMRRLFIFTGSLAVLLNLVCGRVRMIAVMLLALTLAGASPSWSAQAAPTGLNFMLFLTAVPSATYVCTGQTMTFRVSISVLLVNRPGDTGPRFDNIQGSMVESEILYGSGTITPTESFIGNPTTSDPNSVTFTFTAGDIPERITVGFKADVSTFWRGSGHVIQNDRTVRVSAPINVDVRNCTYKVLMIFQQPVLWLGVITGTANEIKLTEDQSKHFTGVTDFNLNYNLYPNKCGMKANMSPTKVEYQADLVDEKLYLTFKVVNIKGIITQQCEGGPPSQDVGVVGSPATVLLPAQGGVTTYSTPYWTYFIIVTREPE
jgi:hypothetical protein